MRVLVCLGLLAAVPAGAQTIEERPLTGTFVVGPEILAFETDPGGRTHLYLNLTGEAAQALWDGMGADPQFEECTGLEAKVLPNGIYCERDPADRAGTLMCFIGLSMKRGRIADARGPC